MKHDEKKPKFTIGEDTSECLNIVVALDRLMDRVNNIDKKTKANMYFEVEQHYVNMRNEIMSLAALSISNALFEGKTSV